jgi:hypothetical protein
MTVLKGVGIALRGLGKALKKDPSTPINPVKPKPGRKETEAYLKKLKGKK